MLTEPLYSSWSGPGEGRRFLAAANVGVFSSVRHPPLVPDAFLSLDVEAPADLWPKRNRSYFLWEYGKPPDVVIEVVSNREGHETGRK
ncbi:MAG: Uma2 family endonuclease, partial [Chloroflexi bacterium]|nr:Uma2 family endonuclease [Chloroflexota bacterium]